MRLLKVLSLCLCSAFLSCGMARAAVSLNFHYDKEAGTSLAEVLGTNDGVIGDYTVAAPLPAGHNSAVTEYYVPTRVLGYLRDEANTSSHSEAATAHTWLQDLMGGYGSTITSQIPLSATVTIGIGVETSKWCGYAAGPDQHCPSGCTPSDNPGTCSGCGCAGTKTFD